MANKTDNGEVSFIEAGDMPTNAPDFVTTEEIAENAALAAANKELRRCIEALAIQYGADTEGARAALKAFVKTRPDLMDAMLDLVVHQ